MGKAKAIIIDDNLNFIELIKRHIKEVELFDIIGIAHDGEEGLRLVKKLGQEIDLILLDLVMPKRDGLWFLEEYQKLNMTCKIIVQTSYNTDVAIRETSSYDVNYYVLKPYDLDYMDSIVNNVLNSDKNMKYLDLEVRVVQTLHKLGVPSHIKGYQYLKESIILVYYDSNYIGAITKLVYPEIADKYNSSVTKVERAIRHAIEVGINRSQPDVINEYFGTSINYEKDKPTNSEYIATLAEYLHLEQF